MKIPQQFIEGAQRSTIRENPIYILFMG